MQWIIQLNHFIFIIIFLLSIKTNAQTPQFIWAHQGGGDQRDHCGDVTVDSEDNYYITGYYNSSAAFGTETLTSAGGDRDIFIVKYNSNGEVLWAKTAGGPGSDAGFGIDVDNNGNIYITGYFEQTAHFGVISIEAQDEKDGFIAKYDASGNPEWVKGIYGPNQQVGRAITVDHTGSIYAVGVFKDYAWFHTTKGYALADDMYLVKYNSNGSFEWVVTEGSTGDDWAWSVDTAPGGNVYISGFFENNVWFGTNNNAKYVTSQGHSDGFVASYTTSGDLVWIRTIGSPGKDVGWDVHVDGNGSCFITGTFSETADFGQTLFSLGQSIYLTSHANTDVFTAKYNATGNLYWAKGGGGSENESGQGVVPDESGGCFITGCFKGQVTFDNQSASALAYDDIFVLHYGNAGNIEWLITPSQSGNRYAWEIDIDSHSDLLIAGEFTGLVKFGNEELSSQSGSSDCLLAKVSSREMVHVFDFEDGTLQGWTWDGIYDEQGNGPWPNLGWGFHLLWITDNNDGILNWGTNGFNPSGFSEFNGDTWWYADLISPDLSELSSWQEANGFSFDLSSNTNKYYYSPLVKLYDTTTGQSKWFTNSSRTDVANSGSDPHVEWIWEGEDHIPSTYSVLQAAVRIWGKVENNYESDVYLDDVTPIQGSLPPLFEAPDKLAALSGYHQAVPLAWTNPSDDVTGYHIFRSQNPGGTYHAIASNISTLYYRDENAENGQTYYYKVKAVYNEQESDFSPMSSAAAVEDGYRLFSGWTNTPPQIDGNMSPGEWDGADFVITTLLGVNRTVRMYALNKDNQLYLAVNDLSDQTLDNGDGLGIFFDENLDRLWPSAADGSEGLINLSFNEGSSVRYSGFSGVWPDISGQAWITPEVVTGAIGNSNGNVQYELSFDLNTGPVNASGPLTLGWSIYVYEGTSGDFTGLWPQAVVNKLSSLAPDYTWAHGPFSYGDLVLAEEQIPARHYADIDGDFDVDIRDIQLVAARYASYTGDDRYREICDIDADGDIDIADIQKVAALYGRTFQH